MSRTKESMMEVERGDEYIGSVDSTPHYFGAVIDITSVCGTFSEIATGEMEPDEFRYFNDKFVDTPEKALAVACDVYNKRHSEPIADLMNDIEFDEASGEYRFVRFFTTNGHRPTEKQMKRWLGGDPEFRLYREEFAIQVYETDLVYDNLIPGAKLVQFPQKKTK